jgi:hypothetical protein
VKRNQSMPLTSTAIVLKTLGCEVNHKGEKMASIRPKSGVYLRWQPGWIPAAFVIVRAAEQNYWNLPAS